MANVEHSTLTTTNLHENKGVSTAADNTVATALTGSTVWTKLTASNLTGTGNAFGAQLLHVRDEKPSGTNGDNWTTGGYRTRVLNTVKTNEISGASVSSNQITLPAGTYYAEADTGGFQTLLTKSKLRDTTTPADLLISMNAKQPGSTTDTFASTPMAGRFTLSGTKVIELQTRAQASGSTMGGVACSFGENEVYSDVKIWKIG